MTNQIVIRSSPSLSSSSSSSSAMSRRTPLLSGTPQSPATSTPPSRKKSKSTVGELAGKTTADICVVCCCCPCVAAEFLILTVKLPANVVRRLWRKRRQKSLIKRKNNAKENGGVLHRYEHPEQRNDSVEVARYVEELSPSSSVDMKEFEKVKVSIDGAAEAAVELDDRMWERFRDAGFWRSPSQRLMTNFD
ncbi:hypothetical protein vseg_004189 [Gypsophila vaccaria]